MNELSNEQYLITPRKVFASTKISKYEKQIQLENNGNVYLE